MEYEKMINKVDASDLIEEQNKKKGGDAVDRKLKKYKKMRKVRRMRK